MLPLPPRPGNAPGGAEIVRRIAALDLPEREQMIFTQITSGNIPDFLRRFCPVQVTNVFEGQTNTAVFYATPDYLAVGSDTDYFLTPLSPNTAQRIADVLGCMLPTRKMVDDIYAAAAVKLAPSPIPPSPAMTVVPVFEQHNAAVRTQRVEQVQAYPLGALTAGHQKDVVISARLASAPGKVAIYGWHRTNGTPIQPLYLGHTAAWVDYSQCIRLVRREAVVNGQLMNIDEALADAALAGLFSDEGVIASPRYPTNALPIRTGQGTAAPGGEKRTGPPEQAGGAPVTNGFCGFEAGTAFDERIASFTLDPEVKVHINAPPLAAMTGKKVLLVFYALPNGNTTAQTIGKTMQPGDDWHFNIQHIGAQTRFLRDLLPGRAIVVAYLENNLKSWPAWRKKHGDQDIPGLLEQVRKIFAGQEIETVLSGHSGGGSLIFGYLNTVERIREDVVRIAFLDSNYAYARARGHKEKISQWLKASDGHALCVLAYNDTVAQLEGKPIVSPAGGTWGKSHEMQRDLAEDFAFTSRTNGGFEEYSALEGRLRFALKQNAEKQILHTVQVERNGFIHSVVVGTPNEGKGYEYFGTRAYTKWIR